jgi:membrane glycosyltransferase
MPHATSRRVVSYTTRPAARIDDSVRERALQAVSRAIGEEDYERLIWSLAKAAANAP